VDGDRLSRAVALAEVVPLEHPGDGVPGGQLDHLGRAHLAHPARVEDHEGLLRIQDVEDLLLVGPGVLQHLLPGERLAGGALAGGVPDHPGEVTDQEQDLVAEVLELAELVDQDRVAEVEVGRGRVESRLHPQGAPPRQLGPQGVLQQNLVRPAPDDFQRLVDRGHRPSPAATGRGAMYRKPAGRVSAAYKASIRKENLPGFWFNGTPRPAGPARVRLNRTNTLVTQNRCQCTFFTAGCRGLRCVSTRSP
jgi:hypothetical protein